jgi:hypothetical protein
MESTVNYETLTVVGEGWQVRCLFLSKAEGWQVSEHFIVRTADDTLRTASVSYYTKTGNPVRAGLVRY